MKILLTGGAGMLGRDLFRRLRQHHEVTAPSHRALDLVDAAAVASHVRALQPDVVINAAAYTAVDRAEAEPERAFDVNAAAVAHLADACRDVGALLCHISTDYVFNGRGSRPWRPADPAAPLNMYGRSKLAGEERLRRSTDRFFIVRTSWLYGHGGANFVETILARGRAGDALRVVNDQFGAPTWTVSLAGAVAHLVMTDRFGIYHYTDRADDGISWYDFAVEILRQAGYGTAVEAVPTSTFPRPARRPANSRLDCSDIEALGIERVDWRDALAAYLKGRDV